jgi:hypothetical protein
VGTSCGSETSPCRLASWYRGLLMQEKVDAKSEFGYSSRQSGLPSWFTFLSQR